MKLEKTVAAHTLTMYTCDCCGDVIKDKASAYITVSFNGKVWYEWWVCGDYCSECGELLANAITRSIQMPERYEEAFRDKDARVKAEVGMIEEQRERTQWVTMLRPELKPCPFCGITDTYVTKQTLDMDADGSAIYSIQCRFCLACGPWAGSESRAIKAWNKERGKDA